MSYIVIRGKDLEEIAVEVTAAMYKGYKVSGSLVAYVQRASNYFCQPMVKEGED